MRLVCLLALALPSVALAVPSADFRPDPRSVQRYGPGYRYNQAGWIVVHIEGKPYERGVQHGRLLAPEIAAHIRCYAATQAPKDPASGWKLTRTLADVLFTRGHDKEYLEEMKGIADGASAAGARFDGRKIDLTDIVALNAWPELMTLDSALKATPNGLDGKRFPLKMPDAKVDAKPSRCSAFAATGPATKDGKVVFGHITMFWLYPSNFYNVWLDIKPDKGHRIVMQSFPAGIHSGMDYYINSAGILISETTITQTRFDGKGTPLASRIRKAIQYADSIDKAVEILKDTGNGLYTNEWLLADVNTNEIAMFELGTKKSKLWRSSKGEWYGGTKGFYWGCNNTKDLEMRLETIASTSARPGSATFVPSPRDKKWLQLFDKYIGKIDEEFGKVAFTTAPIAAFPSVDAKFTTTDMAKELKSWALFGPPLGRTWQPTQQERNKFKEVRPLVSNPWTVLHAQAPDRSKLEGVAIDLHKPSGKCLEKAPDKHSEVRTVPAWRGTLMAKADADLWLALAFSAYERHVALEAGLKNAAEKRPDDRDQLAVSLGNYRAMYEVGSRARPEPALSAIKRNFRNDDWSKVAQGKGVLLLDALRAKVGAKAFADMMDSFGRANAGKEVTTAMFRAHAEKATGQKLAEFFDGWLNKPGLPDSVKAQSGPFSVLSFYEEVEDAIIIYGTTDDVAANRAAAQSLQQALRRRWLNVTVPIKPDRAVKEKDLKSHHLLLIGRPTSNSVLAKMEKSLPVKFGTQSVVVRDETFAHQDTAVLVAAENPHNRRYSVVVVAGLGGAATLRAAGAFTDRHEKLAGEVVVLRAGRPQRYLMVPRDKTAPLKIPTPSR